ncbi:hypothetical protein DFH27DRAFT_609017 [Peziza echinospora]|nr:hypothetical protein DFH27DRAFT_609017 [Peziza echinospora]
MKRRVSELPSDTNATYEPVFGRIKPQDNDTCTWDLARDILLWVTFAKVPLQMQHYALALTHKDVNSKATAAELEEGCLKFPRMHYLWAATSALSGCCWTTTRTGIPGAAAPGYREALWYAAESSRHEARRLESARLHALRLEQEAARLGRDDGESRRKRFSVFTSIVYQPPSANSVSFEPAWGYVDGKSALAVDGLAWMGCLAIDLVEEILGPDARKAGIERGVAGLLLFLCALDENHLPLVLQKAAHLGDAHLLDELLMNPEALKPAERLALCPHFSPLALSEKKEVPGTCHSLLYDAICARATGTVGLLMDHGADPQRTIWSRRRASATSCSPNKYP